MMNEWSTGTHGEIAGPGQFGRLDGIVPSLSPGNSGL